MRNILVWCLLSFTVCGQTDTLHFSMGAYLETYYKHPFSSEKSIELYNHSTALKPAINLALLELNLYNKRWQFRGDFMLGSYAQKNLAAEAPALRTIYQLNALFQLHPKHQIQFGILPSHIGLESAKNWENASFSRSYMAENSPYYESGISWNFNPNPQLQLRVLALSGWQHIEIEHPALGTQVVYQNKHRWIFNSSSFIGNEGQGLRLFHDYFMQVPLSPQFKLSISEDIGWESEQLWHGGNFLLTYMLNKHWNLTGRWEYFSDPHAHVLAKPLDDVAASINLDYRLADKILFRSEFKKSQQFGDALLLGILINTPLISQKKE